jgi:16S rRNA U1498 N3-methylase RsmE
LLGCNLIKEIIEKYDEKLQEERDKSSYRHRGLKPDSIKTVMGVVEFKKTIYEYKENDKKKYKFLLDENLKLSEFGKISENLVDRILNIAVETNSYRDASEQIMQMLNISISHEAVRDIVIKAGMKIGVLVGPEGGFEQKEIDACIQQGAKIISLGKRILRTETASLTALSMLMLHAEMNI